VANFSVATDETYKTRTANGRSARMAQMWCGAAGGNRAAVFEEGFADFYRGPIQSREWQDKEGQKRRVLKLWRTI